jgi:hypothetical protein
MEKVFRDHLVSKVEDFLRACNFHPEKRIKFGNNKAGSTAWSWAPCENILCYVGVEFFQKNQMAIVGIGWTSHIGKKIDALAIYELTVEELGDDCENIDAVLERQAAYFYRTQLGGNDAFFGPVDELASVERAKIFYSDPLLLQRVSQDLGYSDTDLEKNTLLRRWGVMCAYGELTNGDAEIACANVLSDIFSFLENIGIPLLRDKSDKICG